MKQGRKKKRVDRSRNSEIDLIFNFSSAIPRLLFLFFYYLQLKHDDRASRNDRNGRNGDDEDVGKVVSRRGAVYAGNNNWIVIVVGDGSAHFFCHYQITPAALNRRQFLNLRSRNFSFRSFLKFVRFFEINRATIAILVELDLSKAKRQIMEFYVSIAASLLNKIF